MACLVLLDSKNQPEFLIQSSQKKANGMIASRRVISTMYAKYMIMAIVARPTPTINKKNKVRTLINLSYSGNNNLNLVFNHYYSKLYKKIQTLLVNRTPLCPWSYSFL